ncbi:hypothetical protein B0J13DRAFT_517855 [Dactylonectria estremocensis]|uniref:AMP-activated protein kinase glycogen-binding domain-containing protein n=1 Tax=Dactylonectria estremocensis TaxID=1079267 RepID=A0A9P9FHZ3_9HYPO|nr:hypothetical protein B0J13DRAFT_517855 [Dactylonectria estremocensis]
MSSKTPFTVTFKKPGTVPPLFLAGSFSDPEWEPKEMECKGDDDGEHSFQSEVMITPGEDYQFKLRVGEGDWWILAENYPIATDELGNQNNVLNVPEPYSKKQAIPGGTKDQLTSARADDPLPPIPETRVLVPEPDNDGKDTANDLKTPLFAHECLGAYSVESDESEEEAVSGSHPQRDVRLNSNEYSTADVDLNDPTIEKFPSDRTSIMDALRTIQTHLSEDKTHLDGIPTSPRVVSSPLSTHDATDEVSLSPNPRRMRENRLSHGSSGRSRSVVSLGSIAEIAEEPKQDAGDTEGPQVISLPNPNNTASTLADPRSPPSEEDEAVVMKSGTNAKHKITGVSSSQDSNRETVPNHNRQQPTGARDDEPVRVPDATSQPPKSNRTPGRSAQSGHNKLPM